jgi:trypsin
MSMPAELSIALGRLIGINYRLRSVAVLLLTATLGTLVHIESAAGQSFPTAKEFEISQIRRELERIIAEGQADAVNARNALDALDQPESTAVGRQARNRRELGDRRIVNGIATVAYPAVGALLKGADRRRATILCSGTLIGCDKFITAAHCIAPNPSPDGYLVFLPDAGFFVVKEIRWAKGEYKHPYYDLAVLTLMEPVVNVRPMPINDKVLAIPIGFPGTIVGFGTTGGSNKDPGIKREGTVKTSTCPKQFADAKVLCWSYSADVKPSDSASNTCWADSGGGVFIIDDDANGQQVSKLFGVISGGLDLSCTENDTSYNVDVAQFHAWIESAGEGRLSARLCSNSISSILDIRPEEILQLDSQIPAERAIDVPLGTESLAVSMSAAGSLDGRSEFKLALYQGTPSPGASPACVDAGAAQFAFCRIDKPEPGRWTVVVTRMKGEGTVELSRSLVRSGGR